MQQTVIQPELVVSTWPFRTGIIVYDPVNERDIAEWNLEELAQAPEILRKYRPMLNPMRPYRSRAAAIIADLESTQPLLRELMGIDDDTVIVHPNLSDDVERELSRFCKKHGLKLADLALHRLDQLLQKLETFSEEDHHALVADWWETFARPRSQQGPSRFRKQAVPGGKLYRALVEDPNRARRLWREECATPLGDFSLWVALRCHWGWRLEFPEQPPPVFRAVDELHSIFEH